MSPKFEKGVWNNLFFTRRTFYQILLKYFLFLHYLFICNISAVNVNFISTCLFYNLNKFLLYFFVITLISSYFGSDLHTVFFFNLNLYKRCYVIVFYCRTRIYCDKYFIKKEFCKILEFNFYIHNKICNKKLNFNLRSVVN